MNVQLSFNGLTLVLALPIFCVAKRCRCAKPIEFRPPVMSGLLVLSCW